MAKKKRHTGNLARARRARGEPMLPPYRPTIRTPELVREILEATADGRMLIHVLAEPGMPSPSTFREWCASDPELAAQLGAARQTGAFSAAEQCIDIADEALEDPARSSLRVRTRQWWAARMHPRVFGESSKVEHELGEKSGRTLAEVLVEMRRRAREQAQPS